MTTPHRKRGGDNPAPEDSVKFALEYLSTQLYQARLEILGKIKDVEDTVDMIGRQIKRELPPGR
jgi:hypothetical protein